EQLVLAGREALRQRRGEQLVAVLRLAELQRQGLPVDVEGQLARAQGLRPQAQVAAVGLGGQRQAGRAVVDEEHRALLMHATRAARAEAPDRVLLRGRAAEVDDEARALALLRPLH